ncbi:hypothetical protein ACFY2Q_04370 [Micromonospora sp. NPDC000316]|uniref:hypothetical protein n=1 Tax=Micromonospora sp. NPDC000316 TaxID=3364216 RepID=UPI0036CA58D0
MTGARQRLAYAWQNSRHPAVLAGHRVWDRENRPVWPAQRITFPDSGTSLLYAGATEGFTNVVPLLEQLARPVLGPAVVASRHTVPRRVALDPSRLDADVVALGCRASVAQRLPQAASVVLPLRVHLVVDVDGDSDDVRRRISKRERWEFNRNRRRLGWTSRISHESADYWFFYRRMHHPTMRSRHGEHARTERPEVAYAGVFRQGFVFFVEQDGSPVAGALCRWDAASRTLTTRLLGVLDGAAEHYESGAFKAAYHLLLEWCADNDVRHLDFHGTEAFLGKGIFQWKRKFHPRIVLPPNHQRDKRLWWHVRRDTPAVRDLLAAVPVLEIDDDGRMRAVWFHDETRPPRTSVSCALPGIEEQHRHLDEFLAGLPVHSGQPAEAIGVGQRAGVGLEAAHDRGGIVG